MVVNICIPAAGMQRQENHKFKASQELSQKKKKKKNQNKVHTSETENERQVTVTCSCSDSERVHSGNPESVITDPSWVG
jgi:hypothetical protein